MSTLDHLYKQVEDQYFGSHEFNGLPVYNIKICTADEARSLIRRGVELDYFQIERGNTGNPHIKFTGKMDKSHQLAWLNSNEVTTADCLYPHPSRLKDSPQLQAYDNSPYSKALAEGEGQFDFRTFDVSVLEHYRNDPRYYYETDFICGRICITNEHYDSEAMHEHDKVLLETFGFAYDDQDIRYVAVFLRYLNKLSPEQQKIWEFREVKGNLKLNRDYFDSQVMGSWNTQMSIFEAFVQELATINHMCKIIDKPDLFNKTYVNERPREFGFLLRPTLQEFNNAVSLLDKMLSDNLNKKFFEQDIPTETEKERADGKIVVSQKGTIQLLEEWINKYYRAGDKKQVEEIFVTLRKIRKLRQNPAHKVNDNNFDNAFFKEQRELVIAAYQTIWAIRKIFSNHPRVVANPPAMDKRLESGEISYL